MAMKKIEISNERIHAEILPDFGGVLAHLQINGTEILRMNENMLGVANVLAGGIPLLFPFASATAGNEAKFRGRSYTMPMHGFAKDLPFDVVRAEPGLCELRLLSSEVTRRYYPYEFDLRLIYTIVGAELHTLLAVQNTGEGEMPFAAGFHPYFRMPDRSKSRFRFGLKEYWNYLDCDANGLPRHGVIGGDLHLKDDHDTVFWNGCPDCEIICEAPDYRVRLQCAGAFDVITLCTTQAGAACVEPWQARPDAAHRPQECRRLQPGEAGRYEYILQLESPCEKEAQSRPRTE